MKKIDSAMILAAGEGTRFRPQTGVRPKPALPFLNIPLAGFCNYYLKDLNLKNLVVNTYHLPDQVEDLFRRMPLISKEITFSHEKGSLLGSGGGLKKVQSVFQDKEAFLLLNADEMILPLDEQFLQKAIDQHFTEEALSTLVVMKHPKVGTQFNGVWADNNQRVFEFGKSPSTSQWVGWHYIGIMILSPKIFEYMQPEKEQNIVYDNIVPAMRAGEKVQVFPIECEWFETGNLTDYLAATRQCLKILLGDGQVRYQKFLHQVLSHHGKGQYFLRQVDGALFLTLDAKNLEKIKEYTSGIEDFLVTGQSFTFARTFASGIDFSTTKLGPLVVEEGAEIKNSFAKDLLILSAGAF